MVNYNEEILIDNIRYRYYDENYLVSEYGDVFSLKTKTYLKHEISWTGHHRVQFIRSNTYACTSIGIYAFC